MQAQSFLLPNGTLPVSMSPTSVAPPKFVSFLPPYQLTSLGFNLGSTCLFQKSHLLVQSPVLRSRFFGPVGVIMCSSNGESGSSDGGDDGFYIRRCVELARKAVGFTSPNPMVGCVIVKDGKVVGEGFHPKAGQPHAEVFALRAAGDLAENATAYVSLEPCNHFGRTPPCSQALVKAKLKKVVVGMVDPNPLVASKGVKTLKDAGIEVVIGVEEELCKRLNEAFVYRILNEKPLLALRYSLSIDGNFADSLGDGATDCGGYYSQLLQEYDAVILSTSLFTGNLSTPASQEPGANQPFRIIIHKDSGSSNQTPIILNEVTDKVIVFTDDKTMMAQKGIETVILDQINLDTILDYCYRQGMSSVLLDLRGSSGELEELVREGIQKKYISKFAAEILPVGNGHGETDPLIPLRSIQDEVQVENLQTNASDQNVVVEGYFKY